MSGDFWKDVILAICSVGTLALGLATIKQNRRAADRSADVAAESTKVDRERLGMDALEASLKRLSDEVASERRWNAQLVQALRDAGIPVPERNYTSA